MLPGGDTNDFSDTAEGSFPENFVRLSRHTSNKVLLDCYGFLVAQRRKLESVEPISENVDFQALSKKVDATIQVVESLWLTIEENTVLEEQLVCLLMKVNKMKKENTFLKQSLGESQLSGHPGWIGFRNNAAFRSDDSETPTTPTDERSQNSDDLQPSPTPAFTAECTFDGVLQELERCQIASGPPSPSSDYAQELSQSQISQVERSTVSSDGSFSLQEPVAVTGSYIASLRGNRMDLILAADRQKMYAPKNSHLSAREGQLDLVPPQSPVTTSNTIPPDDGHANDLLFHVEGPPYRCVLYAALGVVGVVCCVFHIYGLCKPQPVDGFFESGSQELHYYKRMYGR